MGQPGAGDRVTMPSMERTRGTETSQYPEEKKTTVIVQVVASERTPAQTGDVTASTGVVGPPTNGKTTDSGRHWKVPPQRVKGPYAKSGLDQRRYLSSAGHEKSSVNQRGPSRKAKYDRETDSGPVP